MSVVTWDCETTIKSSFKRKANPFDDGNWVVTHGFKRKGAPVQEIRFGHERPPAGWLAPVLDGTRLLITMNGKFDLSHALQDETNLQLWMDWVARGGQLYDVQLAEYLLCGQAQADQMLSLDEIAPRYGGNCKIDEVKALWNAGVDTPDIEPSLVTRYLCGGVDENGAYQMGDVENTELVAFAQIARAREIGQVNSIMLNMGALLFTVEAERNGMFVDKAQGMVLAEELKVEIDLLLETIKQYIPASIYADQFSWTSRFHKSALIFGGTVQVDDYEYDIAGTNVAPDGTLRPYATVLKTVYDMTVPYGAKYPLVYSQKDELHYLLENGKTMECQWYEHCMFTEGATDPAWDGAHERVMFKAGKQAGEYKTKKVKVDNLDKPKGRAVRAPWVMPGYTEADNPAWKTSDPGVYSTAGEVIEELGDRDVPFLKALASLMKMQKDLGTYFYTINPETGKEGGMLTLVNALGIIHHKLNMVATITARLSSSDPNLQNIPKGNKSKVKLIFKSRFKGGKIIQSDFSSLEVYVQAILTQCKQLIADLRAGLDMHCVRLAAKEGMEYAEVLKLAKGYMADDGSKIGPIKEWDYKRTGAKEYSFQSAFGAGDKAIALKTGMAIEEVARLRAADNARYPEIPLYYDRITVAIKGDRRPMRTQPHPFMPGVMCNLGKSAFRTPDGKLYTYEEQPSPDYLVKRGVFQSFSPTEIKNYVVQGTGGEWAKAAMYLCVRSFYRERNFGGLALLVNQVHDANYVDAHASVAFEAACLLHACMEAASDYMEWRFKWPIPVPVPSDTSWGDNMMEEKSIDGLKERAAVLRLQLRKDYMNGYEPSYCVH